MPETTPAYDDQNVRRPASRTYRVAITGNDPDIEVSRRIVYPKVAVSQDLR